MRHFLTTAVLVCLAPASVCSAQPVHIGLSSNVYGGAASVFVAGLSIDPYNPFGSNAYGLTGSTRLISPGGVAGEWRSEAFAGWGGQASTREGAVALLTGRWTLQYEDAFDGFLTDYHFDVSISGIDANDLAPLIITSPLPGSVISRTPTLFYQSQFTSPDFGNGIIRQTLDIQRAANGQCAFTTPLADGVYDAAVSLSRSFVIDEVFTVTNAGYSGTPYVTLNFTPGPLTLYSNAYVSGLVVPAPGAAVLLGLSGLLAARRRR